jgi:hypothetical protein
MDTIIIAIILGYLLLIWLKSNAFAEYMLVFGFKNILKIAEYKQLCDDGYDGTYVDFLYEHYRSLFIVRLVTCPICLSFWVGAFFMLRNLSFSDFIMAPLTLFFYLVLNKLF